MTDRQAELERMKQNVEKWANVLYDGWQEYANAKMSPENYESMQAIVKKMFRVLATSGYDVKSC